MPENKKLALLRVYQILREQSDEDHPMTQNDLLDRLRTGYGIVADRRTVGRNLSLLKEAGVEIESDRRGSWLSPDAMPFLDEELRLLIDFIRASPFLPQRQSEDMQTRLRNLSNSRFQSGTPDNTAKFKTESQLYFLNMESIRRAIAMNRRIRFTCLEYGIDQRLHSAMEKTVSPRRTVLREGVPLLLCDEGEYRLERMSAIEILSQSVGPEPTPTETFVTIACAKEQIGDLLETFGHCGELRPMKDGMHVRVTIRVNPEKATAFVRRQMPHAAILGPKDLRQAFLKKLKNDVERMEKMGSAA